MAMLYEQCPLCGGAGYIGTGGPLAPTSRPCVCVRSPTPGYTPTGLTTGQVERMADRERALAGDPGVPAERRRAVLQALERAVSAALTRLDSEAGGQ